MAAIAGAAHMPARPAKPMVGGFDVCLYEASPTYYFQGNGRPVVLMTRTSQGAGTDEISRAIGEAAAPGNLKLSSFSSSVSIPEARFSRAALEQFMRRPVKTTVGGNQ
jgi:hypothetical protein